MGPGGGRAYAPPAGEGGAGPTGASPAPFGEEEEEEEGASLARRGWSCWGGTSPRWDPLKVTPGQGRKAGLGASGKMGVRGGGRGSKSSVYQFAFVFWWVLGIWRGWESHPKWFRHVLGHVSPQILLETRRFEDSKTSLVLSEVRLQSRSDSSRGVGNPLT